MSDPFSSMANRAFSPPKEAVCATPRNSFESIVSQVSASFEGGVDPAAHGVYDSALCSAADPVACEVLLLSVAMSDKLHSSGAKACAAKQQQ